MASATERYKKWQASGGAETSAKTSTVADKLAGSGGTATERFNRWKATRSYNENDFSGYLTDREALYSALDSFGAAETYRTAEEIDTTFADYKRQYENAFRGSDAALRWLDQNADAYTWEDYQALREYVGNPTAISNTVDDIAANYKNYWGQFADADDYGFYKTNDISRSDLEAALANANTEEDRASLSTYLRGATSAYDASRYAALAEEDEGFSDYVQQGISLKNPTTSEYNGWMQFGSWRPFGKDIQNYATFARDNPDVFLSGSALPGSDIDKLYQMYYMTDDEVSLYSGLLARDGIEAADEYFRSLSDTLAQRQGGHMVDIYGDNKLAQYAGLYATNAQTAMRGLAQPFMDTPLPVHGAEYASSELMKNLEEDGWRIGNWNVGRDLGEAVASIGNMTPALLAGAFGPGVGVAAMAYSSGSGTLRDSMRTGYSRGEALPFAAVTGIAEGLLSYLLGGISQIGGKITGNFAQKVMSKISMPFARAIVHSGINASGEFLEEFLQSTISPILRNWLLKEENAITMFSEESLHEGFIGAFTSLLMGGGNFVSDLSTESRFQKMVDTGLADAVVDSALDTRRTSKANRLAREIKSGKTPLNPESLGQLSQTYAAETSGDVAGMSAFGEAGTELYNEAMERAETPEQKQTYERALKLAYEAGRGGMDEAAFAQLDLGNDGEAALPDDLRTRAFNTGKMDALTAKSARGARSARLVGDEARSKPNEEGSRTTEQGEGGGDHYELWEATQAETGAVEAQPDLQAASMAEPAQNVDMQTDTGTDMQTGQTLPQDTSPAAQGAQTTPGTTRSDATIKSQKLPDWTKSRGGVVRQDTKGTALSSHQKGSLMLLSHLGKKYGVVFVIQDSISDGAGNRANAAYMGENVFHIALDADGSAYTFFATHEMAHYLKNQNSEAYNMLAEAMRAWADAAGIDFDARINEAREKYERAGHELTRDMAQEEVVGDMLGTIFADEKAAAQMLKDMPRTVLEKLRAFVGELLDTIRDAARRITGAKDLAALAELEGWAEQAATILDAAMMNTNEVRANRRAQADVRAVGADAAVQAAPLAEPAQSTDALTDADADAMTDVQTDVQLDTQRDVQPDTRTDVKPDVKADTWTDVQTDAQSGVKPGAKQNKQKEKSNRIPWQTTNQYPELPDWTKSRGGVVRQDTKGTNLSRSQKDSLLLLSHLGEKYGVVFVTRDSINAGLKQKIDIFTHKNRKRAHIAEYAGDNIFRIALNADEQSYIPYAIREMALYLKNKNSYDYNRIVKSIREWAEMMDIDFDARVNEARKKAEKYERVSHELALEMAQEEVVGDMIVTIFADEEVVKDFARDMYESSQEDSGASDDNFFDHSKKMPWSVTAAFAVTSSLNSAMLNIKLERGRMGVLQGPSTGIEMGNVTRYSMSEFGLDAFDKETKNNIKLRGGIIITNALDLDAHIRAALSGSQKENLYLGAIADSAKNQIEADAGETLFKQGQYAFVVSYDDIRHVEKHYRTVREIRAAVERLFKITYNYDSLRVQTLKDGGKRLHFTKSYADADYYTIDLISKGKRTVDLVTIYIEKLHIKTEGQAVPADISNAPDAPHRLSDPSVLGERNRVPDALLAQSPDYTANTEHESDPSPDSIPDSDAIRNRENDISMPDGGARLSLSEPLTQADVDALRSIGRKSVNEFTSSDIQTTEKWARKFYRELGAKSPFFRAWFGDWRAKDLAHLTSIKSAPHTEMLRGTFKNADTRWAIRVSRVTMDETIFHAGKTKQSVELLGFVDKLIEKAILLDSETTEMRGHKKGANSAFIHKMYVPVTLGKETVIAKLSVDEYYENNDTKKRVYHIRSLETIKPSNNVMGPVNEKASPVTPRSTLVDGIFTVADLYAFVKMYDAAFQPKAVEMELLNPDGTPKTLYFGTDGPADAITPNGAGGKFYLSETAQGAKAYGDTVIPVFANAIESRLENGDIAVSHPGQIKAADGNIGTFDAGNADIRYSLREGVSITESEMRENIVKVAKMEPVVSLGGDEFGKGDVDLVTQVTEYFDGLGGSVENPVLGTVAINKAGIHSSMVHGIGRLKAMAFYAVPNVLEHGEIIDYQKNWKERGYDTIVLGAPVEIKNGRYAGQYYVGAIVMRAYASQRFYLHELIAEKRADTPFKTGAVRENVNPSGASYPSLLSILEKVRDVNSEIRTPSVEEDIRYSLSEISEGVEPEAIVAENARLKGLLDTLYAKIGDWKHLAGKTQPDVIEKRARALVKQYESEYSADTLAKNLTVMADYYNDAMKNGTISAELLIELYSAIMRPVLEQSAMVDRTMWEEGAPLRKTLKSARMTLNSRQRAEVASAYGSYNAFRKAFFGSMTLVNKGTPLETVFAELADQFSYLLDADIPDVDMPMALAAALEQMRPKIVNPYGMDNDQYVLYAAFEAMDATLNLPAAKTYLAAARDEGMRQARLEEKRIAREAARIAQRDANRRVTAERRTGKEALEAERKAGRERTREAVKTVRDAAAERLAATKKAERARAAEKQAQRAATQERLRLRKNIARQVNDLMARLSKPTDNKHIPEGMRKGVFQALASINYTTEAPGIREVAWQARLAQLRNILAVEADAFIGMGVDPEIMARLDAVVKGMDGTTRFADMDIEQLATLSDAFANIRRAMYEQDSLVRGRRSKTAASLADKAVAFLRGRKDRVSDEKTTGRLVNLINFDTMAAGDFMRTQFGDDAGGEIYDMLRDGQDTTHAHLAQAEADVEALFDKHSLSYKQRVKWQETLRAIKLASGQTIYATEAQLMGLYALAGREQGLRHLLGERGGVVLGAHAGRALWAEQAGVSPVSEGVSQADLSGEAGRLSRTVDGDAGLPRSARNDAERGTYTGKRVRARQTAPVRLTEADLQTVSKALSAEQRAVADDMVEYMSGTVAEWGNNASMDMYGYRKYTEPHYWPIQSDRNALKLTRLMDDAKVQVNANKSRGFTKATNEKAAGPVQIGDAFDVFGKHIIEMANYDGYAPAVDNLIKIMNAMDAENGTTLRTELERTTGAAGEQYLRKLLEDINQTGSGANSTLEGVIGGMVSRYKRSAILAKPRVAVQQYTAIARAMNEIAPAYLTKGVAASAKKRGESVREMQKYAPIAWWKNHGNYDTHVGMAALDIVMGNESVRTKIDEASMALAGKADNAAWAGIWDAVKLEIEAAKPDLQAGSTAYWDAVRRRFNEIVDRTQVVDSVLHRSQMARGKGLSTAFTAFMSEPLRSFNMLHTAALDAQRGGFKNAAANKRFLRAAGTLVVNSAFHALILAAFDSLRYRDDEDEDFADRFWQNFAEDINPLQMVPLVSDGFENFITLVQGGSVWDSNMITDGPLAIVEAGVKLYRALGEWMSGEKRYNKRSAYGLTRDLLQGVSRTFGLPVEGMISWLELIVNGVSPGTLVTKNGAKYDALKSAVSAGDAGAARAAADVLLGEGTEMQTVRQTLTSTFKPVYREMFERGDTEGMKALRKALAGFYDKGEAHFTTWLEE